MAHPSTFRMLGLLSLVLLLCGCITIEENYTFKKNGSGTMEYVVDMSAMQDMMKSLDQASKDKTKDQDQDADSPTAMGMEKKATQLEAIDGIKKVKLKKEQDGYIQRMSFSFTDLATLNKALNVLMPDSSGVEQTFFHWEGNTLVRTNNQHAEEMAADAGNDSDTTDLSGVLQSMHYKYSFKFKQDVDSTKLADGMVKETPNARTLLLSTDWSVIMKDPKALDLRITLDK
ncbi:MAG: hypothetical protein ABI373_11225 [Flavobacteriales bacterium]